MENYGSKKGVLRQTKFICLIFFFFFWLGQNSMRGEEGRKQEEEEEEEGEGEEDQNQGMFCLESMGILNS